MTECLAKKDTEIMPLKATDTKIGIFMNPDRMAMIREHQMNPSLSPSVAPASTRENEEEPYHSNSSRSRKRYIYKSIYI